MFGGLGHLEMIIVLVVAVLLFGKKLPEVARSIGSSYRQFKKGLTDLHSQVDFDDVTRPSYTPPASKSRLAASSRASSSSYDDEDYHDEATAPKFQPPPSQPQ